MRKIGFYQIGNFARKLGVTPELLKYCEKKGLIQSVQEENGYRFFDFRQSATVIEYLKLQNQGFSAGEVFDALHAESLDELTALEAARQKDTEQQIRFLQATLQRSREMEEIRTCFSSPLNWRLTQGRAAWFLPHTEGSIFTEDVRVLGRLEDWNRWLPVVESACSLGLPVQQDRPIRWGYLVDAAFAEAQGMDVSEPAEFVPAALQLQIYLKEDLGQPTREAGATASRLMDRLELEQKGDAIQRVIAKMWSGTGRHGYGILQILVGGAAGSLHTGGKVIKSQIN